MNEAYEQESEAHYQEAWQQAYDELMAELEQEPEGADNADADLYEGRDRF